MSAPIDRQLAGLHAATAPRVLRFDDGPELGGSVVVLPSAFNPPTVAHIELMHAAVACAGASRAFALLTTRNVDKGIFGAALPDRVAMLLAAREDGEGFAVGASNQARIMDQAAALRAAFAGTRFDFVVGFDTLERLFAPRYYDDMERELNEFFARHRVLAANRGETGSREVDAWIRHHAGTFRDSIEVIEVEDRVAHVSSTEARHQAQAGQEPGVLPPAVKRYIRERGLYRAD